MFAHMIRRWNESLRCGTTGPLAGSLISSETSPLALLHRHLNVPQPPPPETPPKPTDEVPIAVCKDCFHHLLLSFQALYARLLFSGSSFISFLCVYLIHSAESSPGAPLLYKRPSHAN